MPTSQSFFLLHVRRCTSPQCPALPKHRPLVSASDGLQLIHADARPAVPALMEDDCRVPHPQTIAEIHGAQASNGAFLYAGVHIDNSRYFIFLNDTYTPEVAQQYAHHDSTRFLTPNPLHVRDKPGSFPVANLHTVEKFVSMVKKRNPGSSSGAMPFPAQGTAALEDGSKSSPDPSDQAASHLRGIAHASTRFNRMEGHENDYTRRISQLNLEHTEPFSEKLYESCSPAHTADVRRAVAQWLAPPTQSALLTIDGTGYRPSTQWATRFAVEAVRDGARRHQPVCHCFCGERPGDLGSWPALVVGHLLAQLPPPMTGEANTDGSRGGERHSHRPADYPAGVLWTVFGFRMAAANMHSVTIVLDSVDALYARCKSDDRALGGCEAMGRFANFVRGLAWLMRSGPVVRVMVTSWSSEVLGEIRRGVIKGQAGD